MPPDRKPVSPFLLIGMVLLPAGIVGDSFLHLPHIATFALLSAAIICMLVGIRETRRLNRGVPATAFDQRHKRFGILFVSLVAGFVGGYFLVRHDHPEFSMMLSAAICLFGLVFATSIIAWQIYFRGERPKT
jgi:hypothetical protein